MTERCSEDSLDLGRFMPFRLAVLNNHVTARVSRACRDEFGVSAPEWRTMAALAHYGAMPSKDVCNRTAMDKVRVSRAAVKLLNRGYIKRIVGEKDHRERVLTLTPQGKDVYHQIVPKVLAVERQVTMDLNGRERRVLVRILGKLEQRVPTTSDDADVVES